MDNKITNMNVNQTNNIVYNQQDLNQNNQSNINQKIETTQTSFVKPQKKSKKTLFIGGIVLGILISIILVLILMLGGSSNNPAKIAKKYVNALISQKYDEAFGYVFLPENAFVDSNDYFEHIKTRPYFSTIRTQKIESISEDYTTDQESEYKVSVKNPDNTITNYKIHFKKNYNNEWKIVENNLYIDNWEIIIPGNTKFYINEKEVSRTYIKKLFGVKEKYIIPAISSNKKNFKFENSLQTKEFEYTPTGGNSGEEIYFELTDNNLKNKAYEYIKTTWNSIYTDYINGVNVSDVAKKYFVEGMDINLVEEYYTKSFDSLTRGSSGYKYINYSLIEVVDRKNADNYIISDDVITLNFGYKLTWQWSFSMANEMREMTRFSKIRLKIDGDSFKIFEVPDTDFFSESNQFISQY